MARLLLLWGADTNARDRKRRTPEQLIGADGTQYVVRPCFGVGVNGLGALAHVEIRG